MKENPNLGENEKGGGELLKGSKTEKITYNFRK